ncbi:pyridoxal 5'-phosphate synthase glutaminase subunit PdxT [Clostridium subterminale]|uniref:Pyridoxal 5'-phosphate synthase subunit PdxT n=1 Tax=Clostridium subterminale TaxID=1550 RepID=A0ABN1KVZ0_CLOSU
MITIGVLDLQGAVKEHVDKINNISGATALRVKNRKDLEAIDGLIIPGGESTTIGKLLRDFHMLSPLKSKIENGLPVWGTCAGMIILAKSILGSDYNHLGVMDIEVRRNAYGSQLDSFITDEILEDVSEETIPLVFIRAPYVEKVHEGVKVLCKLDEKIIACRQNNILATSFHPELTKDLTMHKYFYNMCKDRLK